MTHPRNSTWGCIAETEELKALVTSVLDRALVIRKHAQQQTGNWTQVFVEAEMSRRELLAVRRSLDECWDRLYNLAMYNGLPRED